MKHLDITIAGLVQGINFRSETVRVAKTLAICGFVQNMPDGSVVIQAEGDLRALDEFVMWCRKGPWFAKVESVKVAAGELKNYNEFKINY